MPSRKLGTRVLPCQSGGQNRWNEAKGRVVKSVVDYSRGQGSMIGSFTAYPPSPVRAFCLANRRLRHFHFPHDWGRILELRDQTLDRQVGYRIRSIVEHLPDNFSSGARIRTALDLNKGRDRILVKQEMIKKQASPSCVVTGKTRFPSYEQPASRISRINLRTAQKTWVSLQKMLEEIL